MLKIVIFVFSFTFFLACTNVKKVNQDIQYQVSYSGLKYFIIEQGIPSSDFPKNNQKVTIHFILKDNEDKIIEDTYKNRKTVSFRLGSDEIALKGFEEAIYLLKKGGKVRVIIPPELGFGDRTVQNVPANTTLKAEIELLNIE